jgi:uncharacterized membrane protein
MQVARQPEFVMFKNLKIMNAAQLHLALNHAPLFFSLCGGLILIAGMIRNHPFTRQLGLCFLVAAALFTIPVFLTGEGTEELVEKMPGVAENAIGQHEDWAKITLGILAATGPGGIGRPVQRG